MRFLIITGLVLLPLHAARGANTCDFDLPGSVPGNVVHQHVTCDQLCNGNCSFSTLGSCDNPPSGNGDGTCVICDGTNSTNIITATSGPDIVCMTSGNDVVNTGNGNDIVVIGVVKNANGVVIGDDSSPGNYTVDTGNGDDIVVTGSGDDIISGGIGNDLLFGCGGRDVIKGGDGADVIGKDNTSALVFGNPPTLLVTPGDACPSAAIDDVVGSLLCGGAGNDRLIGIGPSHQCMDGGSGQTGAFGVVDCFYQFEANPSRAQTSFDLGTGKGCAVASGTTDSVDCGCN